MVSSMGPSQKQVIVRLEVHAGASIISLSTENVQVPPPQHFSCVMFFCSLMLKWH